MKRVLTLLTVSIFSGTVCLLLACTTKPKQSVALKPPPVHMFLDENGKVTDKPSIDEDIEVETIVTNVTMEVNTEVEQTIVSSKVETSQPTRGKHKDSTFQSLIYLRDAEAWSLLTDGAFTSYPKQPFYQIESIMQNLYKTKQRTITVPVWYWENPSDETNYNKISASKTWVVNEEIADLCVKVFNEIYNDPSKPVINLADKGMGTWSVRGKMHNKNKTVSAHALGASFDINPSTGTFNVNGTVYGNGYGNQPMPTDVWKALPESHKKYHVLYVDSPIVRIFKSNGFYWGGDWKSSKDCMHLAFLGDGTNAREIGQHNYQNY